MSVVTGATLFEYMRRVLMGLGELILGVAGKTAAGESKPATARDAMALFAFHGHGWMFPKRLVSRWSIWTDPDSDFVTAAFPNRTKSVCAGRRLELCLPNPRKTLDSLHRRVIHLHAPTGGFGQNLDLACQKRGLVHWPDNFPFLTQQGKQRKAQQKRKESHWLDESYPGRSMAGKPRRPVDHLGFPDPRSRLY